MKVINRSDETVVYSLPELNNTRRVFQPFEQKEISGEELEALSQSDGGLTILQDYLLVEDKDWVNSHFDAPIEYWWKAEDIKKCLLEDDVELFAETLDYAPEGVRDLLQLYSWKLPITDLNKIEVIKNKTGFDVQAAIAIMKPQTNQSETIQSKTPRRRREK